METNTEIKNTKLRSRRHLLGMTAADVANKIGITLVNYYNIERGIANPSKSKIQKLLELFNCKFEDIF